MVKSVFKLKNGLIESVKVTGHSEVIQDFSITMGDVVCASISTAIIVTVNALESLKVNQNVDLEVKKGYFKAVIKSHDSVVDGLFNNLAYTFNDLSKQYPKYMKNQKEEG